MGPAQHSRQHNLTGIHRNADGGGAVRQVPRPQGDLAKPEYAGTTFSAQGVPWSSSVLGQRRQLIHDWL